MSVTSREFARTLDRPSAIDTLSAAPIPDAVNKAAARIEDNDSDTHAPVFIYDCSGNVLAQGVAPAKRTGLKEFLVGGLECEVTATGTAEFVGYKIGARLYVAALPVPLCIYVPQTLTVEFDG